MAHMYIGGVACVPYMCDRCILHAYMVVQWERGVLRGEVEKVVN